MTAEIVETKVKTPMTSGMTNSSVSAIVMHRPENISARIGVPEPDKRPKACGACLL
ncbi:hypothetical protein D3C81_1384150 [compost metagenome]